ncbi:unnamed protein product [Arabis nemorensis]|uniref:Uncharacterized protein n=1 Tax=Arabis nemorensis TaxID=586526 RepID=A0A565BZ03_9BRAS|nr:unnamed protein product [Arabis nemorensis]
MFAARVRASLKPLFHRRISSSLTRNYLGPVEKDGDQNSVVKLLTMREPSQVFSVKKAEKIVALSSNKDWMILTVLSPFFLPENEWQDSEAKKETSSNGSKHPSSFVVIRIGNLNSKTTDSKIHSMCLSIGPLEGLARVNEDTVDVLFRAKNLKKADSILEKLNEATVDHSQWTAEIVPEASIGEMGMTISSCFQDFEKQLMMLRIIGKDLEILLHSVKHLENHPMAREWTKALECSQEA